MNAEQILKIDMRKQFDLAKPSYVIDPAAPPRTHTHTLPLSSLQIELQLLDRSQASIPTSAGIP